MKKTVLFLLIVLLVFSFCSCSTVKQSVEFTKERAEIVSIDIYDVEKQYYEGDINCLREENTPIYTIGSDAQNDFLEKLKALEYEKEVAFLPIPMDGGCDYSGYIVSVVYADGSYDLFAEEGMFSYYLESENEEKYKYDHSDYIGTVSWTDFIEAYIEK